MKTTDSQGQLLQDGDNVIATQSLRVKGSDIQIKQGELIRNIRTINRDNEVEARIGQNTVVLRTEFLEKSRKPDF